MNRYVCNDCGHSGIETDLIANSGLCPNCGGHSINLESSKELSEPSSLAPESAPQRLDLQFTGTAKEYFRIWIVNTFLTIITLGIYAAWAKVRNRQYFYKNTILDGHSFDFTANPKAILKGHLIIGAGVGLYHLSNAYNQVITLILIGTFALIFPFLIYKSLRFFLHNSTYRNIRFRFRGTLKESYRTYLLLPVLIPFTIGLIFPYWAFRRKKYFFSNLAYGTTDNSFKGRPWPFYKMYLALLFVLFALMLIGGFSITIFIPLIKNFLSFDQDTMKVTAVLAPFAMLIVMFAVSIFFQQVLYAWTTNYCCEHSQLGTIRLHSSLKGSRLFRITFTNILAILFSLGLLIPWAKVRRMKYILSNLTIITEGSLDNFAAAAEPDQSAYGEAATDFFDLDIGL